MKQIFFITLFLYSLLLIVARPVSAQTTQNIIWEYSRSRGVTSVNDLIEVLEYQTQKVITAGHLAPFRTIYGEGRETSGQYNWYHRYDVVYTLSLLYPYVNTTLQQQIRTYLQSEMQTYPLWNAGYLNAATGTKRDSPSLASSERVLPADYNDRPKLFALYALWLYAHNTGDWQYIQNNWASIVSFYNSNSSEVGQYYTSIAGAIGAARMAYQKPSPDTNFYTTVSNTITNGLTNGRNYTQFATTSMNAFEFIPGEEWSRTQSSSFMGFHFLDITPEIGRYIAGNSVHRQAVIGTEAGEQFTLMSAVKRNPFWYMAQAPMSTYYYGEGSGSSPDYRAMVFPIKAWIQKEASSQLRSYIDAPDAVVGDFYYMQNIVRTIEAHGQECWENIQTTQIECPQTPVVSPTPAPTPTPPPAADINSDGDVNGQDVVLLLNNWLGGGACGIYDCDLDNDGKINGLDFGFVFRDWGL